jgi:hypothetical protein
VPTRLPCTGKGASSALLVLSGAAHARHVGSAPRGACARRCGFESGAGTEPARRRAGPEVRAPGRLTQGHDDLSGYVVPHHSNHSGNLTLIPPPKKIASYPFLPCGEQGWWGNVDDVNIVLSVLVR